MKQNERILKIMIADDDADDMQYLSFLFKNHQSFEIIGLLSSGDEIVSEIIDKNNIPDVLITDLYMPRMTGSEAVLSLMESGALKDISVFIISTTINELEQEKFNSNPKVIFLEKPVTLPQINDLPEILLEKMNFKNINKI